MKRRDLLKKLKTIAQQTGNPMTTTEGGRHTQITIGPHVTYVPRHREIDEHLTKEILKQAKGLK